MANKKFSEFTLKTDSANVDFLVGFDGSDNVRIAPSNLSSGGASSLNGLSDVLVDTASLYVGTIPSGLSGNPQGNTTLGISAGLGLTSGANNTIIGNSAGVSNTGSNVVAIGSEAARVNTADQTVSVGYQSGYSQTSGVTNTYVGYQSGYSTTTGRDNAYVGRGAGYSATGSRNSSLGDGAFGGGFGHSGTDNVVFGYRALQQPSGASNYNVAIGSDALRGSGTKSNNVAVGYQAGTAITTGSNNIVIGYQAAASAVDVSNEITLGDANIATLRCQVQTISALSDSRDKTNIQPSTYGLDLISQLHPVTFDWNMRDGAKVGQKDLGFIAQELQEVDDENLQLVYDNNPDRLEASYGRLIPVLVQAIKELKAEVELLKA